MNKSQKRYMMLPMIVLLSFYANFMPLWLIVVLVVNIVSVWFYHAALSALWSKFLLGVLVLAASAGVFIEYSGFAGRDAGIALLLLMAAFKWWEIKRYRDVVLIVLLYYFLTAGVFLFTQNLITAVICLISAWFTTDGWLSINDNRAANQGQIRFNAVTNQLFLWALPGSLALFLFFPRLNYPFWHMPPDPTMATTGLSEQLEPGSIARLTQSDEIAFRVKFHNAPPANEHMYWRALVFWQTDGERWTAIPQPRLYNTRHISQQSQASNYTVILEPHGKRWLFTLDIPMAVPLIGGLYQDFRFKAHDPVTQRTRYEVTSMPQFRISAKNHDYLPGLQLPAGQNPRARQLARQLSRAAPDEDALIQRFMDYFRKQAFSYSLTPPLAGMDHQVDRFLFETKQGFCEHYANALAFLLRAAGIPARIVSGYQGGEYNPAGEYYIVRQRDAHAWVEAYLKQSGWIRLDPTAMVAPQRIQYGIQQAFGPRNNAADPGTWQYLWYYLDSANTYFNDTMTGFNGKQQLRFFQLLGWEGVTKSKLMIAAVVVTTMIMLLVGVKLFISPLRRNKPPELKLYHRFCKKMARCTPKAPGETPWAYGQRLAAKHPQSDHIRAFIEDYNTYRYGKAKNKKNLHHLQTLLRALKT